MAVMAAFRQELAAGMKKSLGELLSRPQRARGV